MTAEHEQAESKPEPLHSLDGGALYAGQAAGALTRIKPEDLTGDRLCELYALTSIACSLSAVATLLAERGRA